VTVDEFVLARVAEREEVARKAAARVRGWRKDIPPPWISARQRAERLPRSAATLPRFEGRETPEQVLAWCTAVRRIVAEYRAAEEGDSMEFEDGLLRAVRLLAEIDAGHPEFQPAWKTS
jgi:capsule polysaccharide export protein KpsC/LpsZ